MAAKLKHNHPQNPFGAYEDQGACPRCDQLRAIKLADGETPHNHKRLAFGARKPLGDCPRCDELHGGAKPRESVTARAERLDAQRAAEIRHHFRPGHDQRCPYMTNGAGVCVFGDW